MYGEGDDISREQLRISVCRLYKTITNTVQKFICYFSYQLARPVIQKLIYSGMSNNFFFFFS